MHKSLSPLKMPNEKMTKSVSEKRMKEPFASAKKSVVFSAQQPNEILAQ